MSSLPLLCLITQLCHMFISDAEFNTYAPFVSKWELSTYWWPIMLLFQKIGIKTLHMKIFTPPILYKRKRMMPFLTQTFQWILMIKCMWFHALCQGLRKFINDYIISIIARVWVYVHDMHPVIRVDKRGVDTSDLCMMGFTSLVMGED